jgi:thiol:disulfide interchange protein DsbC
MTGTCWSVLMRTAELLGLSMRVTLVVVAMLCGSGPVVAEELPEGAVRATFEAKFPGVTIKHLSPTEIAGWYLVETDGAALEASILYVHESGRYVFRVACSTWLPDGT